MKIRIKVPVSGGRNGHRWPPIGTELNVDSDEGAALCAAGIAEPIATREPVEKRDTPARKPSKK